MTPILLYFLASALFACGYIFCGVSGMYIEDGQIQMGRRLGLAAISFHAASIALVVLATLQVAS